jgi:hypothetical protein
VGTAPWGRPPGVRNPQSLFSFWLCWEWLEGREVHRQLGSHSPCPGVTAWYQAWKPEPSTLLSETKATRRWLVLVLSVGGGTLPHTLKEARLGAMDALNSGMASVELAWALRPCFLNPWTGGDVVKKTLLISQGARIFLAPAHSSLHIKAPLYRLGNWVREGSDLS